MHELRLQGLEGGKIQIDIVGVEHGLLQQFGRIAGQGVAQALDTELAAFLRYRSHHQARLLAQSLQKVVLLALPPPAIDTPHQQHQQQRQADQSRLRRQVPAIASFRSLDLLLQQGFEQALKRAEDGHVAIETVENGSIATLDVFQHLLHLFTQLARRIAAYRYRKQQIGTLFDENRKIAETDLPQLPVALGGKGVADEIADCPEHRGHHVGVAILYAAGLDVPQQQAGLAVDQEDLFDAVVEAVQQDHLAVGHAAAPGLETPFQALPGQAHLQRLIEIAQQLADGFGNGATDRRTDGRIQGVGKTLAVALDQQAHHGFHRGGQAFVEFAASFEALERQRQQFGQPSQAFFRVAGFLVDATKALEILAEKQSLEGFQVFPFRRAVSHDRRIASSPVSRLSPALLRRSTGVPEWSAFRPAPNGSPCLRTVRDSVRPCARAGRCRSSSIPRKYPASA